MSTTTTVNYGARTAFANASNLNSLGAGSSCGLGAVDNSSAGLNGADAFLVDFAIALNSTGVSTTGQITLYLIQSAQSTSAGWTDGINPAGASASVANARAIGQYNANVNGQVVQDTFRLPVPDPGKFWSIVPSNGSGAALAASGHSFSYTPITYVNG